MPAGTLRAWVLGIIWAIVIPGVNQFYFFRYPSITIGPVRLQASDPHIPPLTLPLRLRVACRAAAFISSRSINVTFSPASSNIRRTSQSRALLNKRARGRHHHGWRGCNLCLCSMCPLCIHTSYATSSDTSSLDRHHRGSTILL